MTFKTLLACALALGAGLNAAAQKVYRCGPDGRIYQQTACADGKTVDASDPRTPEQRQAAQAVAQSEAKAAEQLDRSLTPASAPRPAKARPEAAPASKDKPASAAKSASKKAEADTKPILILIPQPHKPKSAASGAAP